MLVLGYFLLSVLSVRCEDDRREVKMFEDIESQDIIDNFDSFPLLRRNVKASGWCEVSWTRHRNSTITVEHFPGSRQLGRSARSGWRALQ